MTRALTPLALLAAVLSACATPNPDFPLTVGQARHELSAMRDDPKPLERPLVIIGGWNSPGIAIAGLADRLRETTTTPDDIFTVTVFSTGTFDTAAQRVVGRIEERYPSDDPTRTTELDVIGLSMGGLVARYAALPQAPAGKRLAIARLFTLATPHKGAARATTFTLDDRVRDMAPGSDFLNRLDQAVAQGDATYQVIPYARTNDWMVGTDNAAWTDGTLHWVPNEPFKPAHLGIASDRRLNADIARRLRGEDPYAVD